MKKSGFVNTNSLIFHFNNTKTQYSIKYSDIFVLIYRLKGAV